MRTTTDKIVYEWVSAAKARLPYLHTEPWTWWGYEPQPKHWFCLTTDFHGSLLLLRDI